MNPKKVLVIEDESDIRLVVRIALEKDGHFVQEAGNGEEGWTLIQKEKPDLILLDLMMPVLDGHSLNLRLKENPETEKIPVIVMTGKAHLKELLSIREDLKVTAYFEKPFPVKLLLEKVNSLLTENEGRVR